MNLKKANEEFFFKDRRDAGIYLASKLGKFKNKNNILVLGLPRGGVPVAYEVAQELKAPLDVFVVRKLGLPGQEELAMGAIAHDGITIFNEEIAKNVPQALKDEVIQKEKRELDARERRYRCSRPFPSLSDRKVILVDDGMATGASMLVAVKALRKLNPIEIIVAVPVSAVETCQTLNDIADEVICAQTPQPFFGVGTWYEDFYQTTDEEVLSLLGKL